MDGRTTKISKLTKHIEVVMRDDGSFDIFSNREVIAEWFERLR